MPSPPLRRLFLAAAWLVFTAPATAAPDCQPARLDALTARLAAARAELQALPLPEFPAAAAPRAARPAIATAKAQIVELVRGTVSCLAADLDPQQLPLRAEQALAHRIPLHADGGLAERAARQSPSPGWQTPAAPDGYTLQLETKTWPAADGQALLAVLTHLQIACGEGALLQVFESTAAGWHEALRWPKPPYALLSGAYGGLGSAISPPDAAGRWFG